MKPRSFIVDEDVLGMVKHARERISKITLKDRLDCRIEMGRLVGVQSAQIQDFATTIGNQNISQAISEKLYKSLTKDLVELTLAWLDFTERFTKEVPSKDEEAAKMVEEVTEKLTGKKADSRLIS